MFIFLYHTCSPDKNNLTCGPWKIIHFRRLLDDQLDDTFLLFPQRSYGRFRFGEGHLPLKAQVLVSIKPGDLALAARWRRCDTANTRRPLTWRLSYFQESCWQKCTDDQLRVATGIFVATGACCQFTIKKSLDALETWRLPYSRKSCWQKNLGDQFCVATGILRGHCGELSVCV